MKLRYSLASLLMLLTLIATSAAAYVLWINRPDFRGKVLERQEDSVLVAVEAARYYDTDRVWVHLPEATDMVKVQEGKLISRDGHAVLPAASYGDEGCC